MTETQAGREEPVQSRWEPSDELLDLIDDWNEREGISTIGTVELEALEARIRDLEGDNERLRQHLEAIMTAGEGWTQHEAKRGLAGEPSALSRAFETITNDLSAEYDKVKTLEGRNAVLETLTDEALYFVWACRNRLMNVIDHDPVAWIERHALLTPADKESNNAS